LQKYEKELASQNFGSFFLHISFTFLIFATKLITITLKRRLLCKQQRTIHKEETIRKFKQLLKHKEEMLERAKQYDGIDIYAKTEIHY